MNHVGHLRKKSPLHLCRLGEGWWDPEPLGEVQAESIQQGRLGGIGTDDAPQAELAAIGGGQDHIGALDAAEFVQDRPWALPQAGPPLPLARASSRSEGGAAGVLGHGGDPERGLLGLRLEEGTTR